MTRPELIRIGVIGCGYWGPKQIRVFSEIANSSVAIVSDLREERLNHVRERYPGTKTTKDYRDLWSTDVDAVVIATPVSTHYSLAKEALLAGKHVLVEKPISFTSAEGEELVELAERHNRTLMVGHTFEYNPAVEYLRDYIASGKLGKLYYISATRVNLGIFQKDINVMWDLAPHDLSILRFVLGMSPISVSASGQAYVQEKIHDVAYLTLHFPDKVLAHIRVSWLDPCKIRRLTVVGSKKMIVYDDVEPTEKIKIYDKGVDVPPYSDTLEEFHLSYRYGDITTPHISLAEPLKLECEHFIHCIATGETPRSDGRSGVEVVRILEVAQRSLSNGSMQEPVG